MLEDLALQLAEFRSGLEPELLRQSLPGRLEDRQGPRLAPRLVERQHQLRDQPLTEWVLANERLELRHEFCAAPEPELGVDALLEREQPPFLEPPGLLSRERLVQEVCESRPPPEADRVPKHRGCAIEVPVSRCSPRPLHKRTEPIDVELPGTDTHEVARCTPLDPLCSQQRPKPRDVGVERTLRRRRRLRTPHPVDETIPRHDLVRVQQQHREQRPLLRPAKRQRTALHPHLDRAQEQELHDDTLGTSATRLPDTCNTAAQAWHPRVSQRRESSRVQTNAARRTRVARQRDRGLIGARRPLGILGTSGQPAGLPELECGTHLPGPEHARTRDGSGHERAGRVHALPAPGRPALERDLRRQRRRLR